MDSIILCDYTKSRNLPSLVYNTNETLSRYVADETQPRLRIVPVGRKGGKEWYKLVVWKEGVEAEIPIVGVSFWL